MEIFVQLKMLSSELTHEEVAHYVGLSCDVYWKKGDLRKGTQIKEKFNGCSIKSRLEKDEELIQHIEDIFGRLEGVSDRFKSMSKKIDVLLSCAIYSNEVPALYFDKSIIEKISNFGASFDIDLYVLKQ